MAGRRERHGRLLNAVQRQRADDGSRHRGVRGGAQGRFDLHRLVDGGRVVDQRERLVVASVVADRQVERLVDEDRAGAEVDLRFADRQQEALDRIGAASFRRERQAGRADRHHLRRRPHQAHGQDVDIAVVRQRDAAHGLAGFQVEAVAVDVEGAVILPAAGRVAVGCRSRNRFTRIALRGVPVADTLREGLAGAVGVVDGEGLVRLVAVDGCGQQLQRRIFALRQSNGLPVRLDDVVGIGRAQLEGRAVPGQAAAQQVGRQGVAVAVESARKAGAVGDDPFPVKVVLPLPLGPYTKSAAPGSSENPTPANNLASPRSAARSCASSIRCAPVTMTARIIAEGCRRTRHGPVLARAANPPQRGGMC